MDSNEWPIRRSDRALSRDEALEVVRRSHEAVFAVVGTDGLPYSFPITTCLWNNAVYFHCAANAGRKEDALKANPAISLTFIGSDARAEKEFSVNYASATLEGRATLVTDPEEKRASMLAFCEHNAASAGPEAAAAYYGNAKDAIDVWRIDITRIAGKARNKALYFGG